MPRKTVAVVGASGDRSKFSNKAVRAYVQEGWDVYPVNPRGGQIEGLKVFKLLEDIPVRIERVTFYVPPSAGVHLLNSVALVNPDEFFVNPGAESEELLEQARDLGLDPIVACSITNIGVSPEALPG